MLQLKISSFKSTRDTEVRVDVVDTVISTLLSFKQGEFEKQVNKIRAGNSEIKKQLPTFAFHGIFKHFRQAKDFIDATGIIILDIDDIDPQDDLEELKRDILESSPHVLATMISPSGDGIKILYCVDSNIVTADSYRMIGKQIVNEFTIYGKVDYLSVTDCLIATYDPNLLINPDAIPASIYINEQVLVKKTELEELDKSKRLWTDAEDFFDTVLNNDIAEKTNSNFHFIQVAVFDLAKFGFKHPKQDLSFVIDYAEQNFKKSDDNKQRFREAVTIASDIDQSKWPYRYDFPGDDEEDDSYYDFSEYQDKSSNNSDESDDEDDLEGMIDYKGFWEKVLTTAKEGDRVGFEISLQQFANIFRFRGTGILTITGIPGHGKAQPLSSKIQTPNGEIMMKDVRLNDQVMTIGGVTKIVGIYPQGIKDVYTITFSDGSSTQCCKEHLWKVIKRGNNKKTESLTLSLGEMMDQLRFADNKKTFIIPTQIAQYPHKDVILDPYMLGALLGDGYLGKGSILLCTSEQQIEDYFSKELDRVDCKIAGISKKGCRELIISKKTNSTQKSFVEQSIIELGLRGNFFHKFIPKQYLYNSVQVRMDLLRGLLDTDGVLDKSAPPYLSTSSPQLAQDFKTLIQSLGGTAKINSQKARYVINGVNKVSKNPAYRVSFHLPESLGNPFLRCKFRVDRWNDRKFKAPHRAIEKIELTSREEVQCIMVEDSSHLYYTDQHIITHNTEFVDQCILDLARLFGHQSIIVGFEQTPQEHIIKLLKKLFGLDVTCNTFIKSKENVDSMKLGYDYMIEKIQHIDTTKVGGEINTILKACATRIQKLRSEGGDPKYVVIDPFNMLSIKGKYSGHEKIEEILRRITQFAHQMDVLVLLVAHPFKMRKDEKTGKYEIPDFYSVKGSSAFFEMSYHGLVVYRMGYLSTDQVMVKTLKVKQSNLGKTEVPVFFGYERNSGRYIPQDEEGNELKGDHRENDWLKTAKVTKAN